jgi:putative ABC transport system substrate-binding protein
VAFVQGLQELGWTDGRNVWIDTRWAAGDADRFRKYAAELIALAPDVILASGGTGVGAIHLDLIITLAAKHKLPTICGDHVAVTGGGLLSYAPNFTDQYRHAASYVDRILKGEKPADLPVQAPTKYELAINLKTARALRLDVPATLLARADAVIE